MSAGGRGRVLAVGYNAWDVVVPVAGPPPADAKVEAPGMTACGGGPAANAAVALARLGLRVSLATSLGDDAAGAAQAAELRAAGVDLGHSRVAAGCSTPLAVILADPAAETRTIYWSRGALPRLPADAVPRSVLDHCDLLYLDGHEPDLSLRLAAAARARGLPVVLDAGSVRERTDELVPLCTDVVGSRLFAGDLTGRAEPLAALAAVRALGPMRVGTTFGHGGVLGLDGHGACVVAAHLVDVRDTTGAGDAFHAGYACGLLAGRDFRASLDLGAAVAALKCTGWGGRKALPGPEAVEALLARDARRPLAPELAALG